MNNYSHFELELENLMKTQILQFSGFNDGLNSDYQFQIDFLSSTKCDPGKILNSNACFMRYANTGKIYTHGIIDKIQYFGRLDNSYHYQVYLSSPLCRLKKQIRNRRFINKKATQIIQEVLLEAGWKTIDFQIQIETYNPIISCFTQYNEPDHQLIERLCTRYGWIYYFSRDKQRVILHLKDNCKAIQTFKLSYYPNTQLKLDKISISQIQQFINFLPKNIQLKNYSLTTPDTDLTVKTTSKSLIESRGVLEIYGIDYETHEEGEFLADVMQQQLEWQREVFVAVTNDIRLQPGDVIELKEHPKQHFNKRYRVLTLTHKGKQISGINLKNFNEDKTSHYHNQAILIPENISYKKPCQYTLMQDCRWCDSEILRPEIISDTAIYKNNLPSLLAGKLIGNNKNETDIDSEGCYALQMRFPEENSEELDNQHRIQLLQPYGGQFNKNSKAYGLHFPFKVGSEVAVTHSNENYSLILGGIPNLTALTPVNNHNFSQNILRTWRNQEFCMDDLTRQSGILLATEHENQKLLLSTEKETNGVYCRSEFGEIKLHFAKEFISTVGQDHTIQAQMQKIVVNEDCHIFTELGEIYYRSGNQINLAANKDVLFASRENFETDAKTDFSATSKNHFYFYTRIGNSTIYSQQGDISLKSHGQMSLQAHQKFSLLTGMASIGINPSGQMILQAGSITFSSPVIHVYPA